MDTAEISGSFLAERMMFIASLRAKSGFVKLVSGREVWDTVYAPSGICGHQYHHIGGFNGQILRCRLCLICLNPFFLCFMIEQPIWKGTEGTDYSADNYARYGNLLVEAQLLH